MQARGNCGAGAMKAVHLLYGKDGLSVRVPQDAAVLAGRDVEAVPDAQQAVAEALAEPIAAAPLADLLVARRPRSVAVTISDITRPVPNRDFLPGILHALNRCGVADSQIAIIIGAGMHRPATPDERRILLGEEIPARVEVIDHRANDPAALVELAADPGGRAAGDPPVRVNRRFADADFRIVTGCIEPHFMAGFSGGRKGVCPALVDLDTIQRFHGFETLADPRAAGGVLAGNPCHEIALRIARAVGVDFLFNVALTRDRRLAGIYCGDLVGAHEAGCRQVAEWAAADIDAPFDLVVASGGGYPLDQTFYQTVKGMCTALPALGKHSTLLVASECWEGIDSPAYADLLLRWDNNWQAFLVDIEANKDRTDLCQWEFQMHARVLERIGLDHLWFVSDGIPPEVQRHLAVRPLIGKGDAQTRAQRAVDEYLAAHPAARVAVIPDGPYTMLRRR